MNDEKLLDIFNQYLKIEKQSSNNTIESYMRDIRMFSEVINIPLKDVSSDDIIKYLSYLRENYQDSTVSRKIAALKTFYKYLSVNGYLKNNPTSEIKLRSKKRMLPKYLTVDEINKFLNSIESVDDISSRNKAMFETLYATGVRVSELLNIKVGDIYLDEYEIKVFGKGSKQRIVIVNDTAKDALNDYIFKHRVNLLDKPSDYLFVNSRGGSLSRQGFYKILKTQCLKVGITDVSPHKFRHSIATHMIQSGADLRMVQELLGHTDITVTQVYTHLNNQKIREEYDKVHVLGKDKNE